MQITRKKKSANMSVNAKKNFYNGPLPFRLIESAYKSCPETTQSE